MLLGSVGGAFDGGAFDGGAFDGGAFDGGAFDGGAFVSAPPLVFAASVREAPATTAIARPPPLSSSSSTGIFSPPWRLSPTGIGTDQRELLVSLATFSLAYTEKHPSTPPSSSWRDVALRIAAGPLENDEVARVLDGGNAVKLKRGGVVKFGAVRTPSGYGGGATGVSAVGTPRDGDRFPDCLERSPAYAARKLLPPGTKVGVRYLDPSPPAPLVSSSGGGEGPRLAVLVRSSDGAVVNLELVRSGFARPSSRGRDAAERIAPGWMDVMEKLQAEAKEMGRGVYVRCDGTDRLGEEVGDSGRGSSLVTAKIDLDSQFEPIDATTSIEWGDDGGKQVIKTLSSASKSPPTNPGDIKGCSDFATYEDALRWFERYEPYFGDVAKLDRDGDGVPCPGLPHTNNSDRYRMKIPRTRGAMEDRDGGNAYVSSRGR